METYARYFSTSGSAGGGGGGGATAREGGGGAVRPIPLEVGGAEAGTRAAAVPNPPEGCAPGKARATGFGF